MKSPNRLRYALFLFFLISLSSVCFSQGREMKDSTGLRAYLATRDDTLLIRYDSAYLLNKTTFTVYQEAYKRVRNGNLSNQKVLLAYDSLVSLQDRMLKAKESDYQFLKKNFDSLVTASNTFVNRTDVNVMAINQSLTKAEGNLTNIKALLDDSLQKLKAENKQRLKIAVKGFVVGIGVASLVFLIAK